MVRLRAIPLFAELKDLDLRPHPPHDVAKHHAAQRVKSVFTYSNSAVAPQAWFELAK